MKEAKNETDHSGLKVHHIRYDIHVHDRMNTGMTIASNKRHDDSGHGNLTVCSTVYSHQNK